MFRSRILFYQSRRGAILKFRSLHSSSATAELAHRGLVPFRSSSRNTVLIPLLSARPNGNVIRLELFSSGSDVVDVEGPAFAESISEGDIRWIKSEGDTVNVDDVVAEIETDKTTVEVPAPFAGKIVKFLVGDGDKVTAKQKLYQMQKGAGDTKDESSKSEETTSSSNDDNDSSPPESKSEEPEKKQEVKASSSSGDSGKVIDIEGPTFAESISEGDIRWVKSEGDTVNVDDVVAEIETDKTTVEVPAPFAGIIVKFLVSDGEKVAAKQKLYQMQKSGESGGVTPPPASEPSHQTAKVQRSEHTQSEEKKSSGVEIPKSAPPVPPPPKQPMQSKPTADIGAVKAAATAGPFQSDSTKVTGDRSETRVKMNRMRQRIAQRLKDAQNTNAMLTTFNEVDLTNLLKIRKTYQEEFTKKHGVKLGLMSPFVRASAIALQDQPILNAVIDGAEIVYRNFCDISIAVATPKGLVVPVVRNVENMNYAVIEKTLAELGKKARDGKIAVEDMEGGTFTISNGGVFGSMFGTPIINPPQSAILGMHGIFDRPMAIDGKVEVRPMMYVALTYDHRLIDGREAVLFLRKVKQAVEDPVTILLDL